MIGSLPPGLILLAGALILPLVVFDEDRNFDFWSSLRNVTVVLGVLAGLVYFFFSVEHKGAIGHVSRVGIWVLMITFGAAFGYTVMGRIALLSQRIEFLLDDWLWLIDPMTRRLGM
jgi:voltage-gated potassium channel Kch